MRLEARLDRASAGNEEADALLRHERRHRILPLAAHVQRLAARHEHGETRAGSHEPGDLDGCLDEMLEVVEQEEQPLLADPSSWILRVERLRRGVEHEPRIAKTRERHPVDTVREAVGDCASRLQG